MAVHASSLVAARWQILELYVTLATAPTVSSGKSSIASSCFIWSGISRHVTSTQSGAGFHVLFSWQVEGEFIASYPASHVTATDSPGLKIVYIEPDTQPFAMAGRPHTSTMYVFFTMVYSENTQFILRQGLIKVLIDLQSFRDSLVHVGFVRHQ